MLVLAAAATAVACHPASDPTAVVTATDTTTGASTSGDEDFTDGSSGADTTTADAQAVALSGAVQKGPFILGSTVSISPLDAAGNPTGSAFMTQTINDRAAEPTRSFCTEVLQICEVRGSLGESATSPCRTAE